MSPEQKQLIRENGIKELSEEVNGKPLNFVIGQYVERKDVGGLAEFFRAYISDAKETLEKYVDLAIKQTEERMVVGIRKEINKEIHKEGQSKERVGGLHKARAIVANIFLSTP